LFTKAIPQKNKRERSTAGGTRPKVLALNASSRRDSDQETTFLNSLDVNAPKVNHKCLKANNAIDSSYSCTFITFNETCIEDATAKLSLDMVSNLTI
jgi:hypothetical protein